ncbi:unnamed protein product, partial [Rotaria sp. Silwood2]
MKGSDWPSSPSPKTLSDSTSSVKESDWSKAAYSTYLFGSTFNLEESHHPECISPEELTNINKIAGQSESSPILIETTILSPTTATSSNKCSDFYLACRNNKIDEVQALLETMDTNDIGRVEPNGMTALHAACFHGHLEIVKLLLMVGADRAIQ